MIAGLPEEAECLHAIYSGTIAAFYFDPSVVAPTENATTCVAPGDLIFTHYEAGTRHGHPGALSEVLLALRPLCPPHDPGAVRHAGRRERLRGLRTGPRTYGGHSPRRCERLRYDGTSTIQIRTF